MAKKTIEIVDENDVVIGSKTVEQKEITTNFGRDDLNELRDAVNFLISRLR